MIIRSMPALDRSPARPLFWRPDPYLFASNACRCFTSCELNWHESSIIWNLLWHLAPSQMRCKSDDGARESPFSFSSRFSCLGFVLSFVRSSSDGRPKPCIRTRPVWCVSAAKHPRPPRVLVRLLSLMPTRPPTRRRR